MNNRIINLIARFNYMPKALQICITIPVLMLLSPFLLVYGLFNLIKWGNVFGV